MSFRKPFQAQPVKLGPYWRAEQRKEQRKRTIRLAVAMSSLSLGVFVVGMALTNWAALSTMLPTYYPSCSWARTAGAPPIASGSPGYRTQLDADNDGIACEGFQQD
jgi:hypothetical protein